ncbi:MAG: hypothetical protein A2086_00615 [Spirochaetes bacterium GWD1_27_9]|nr:MAG: hypothetical protein A2Z98_05125 [Spirochaetes bacterium GWB1_27_13]OHD25041.1 MAG: hypothetical protein A2Y34_03180 [Spirochaetes bacterium GWC1_27_15]OHD32512.1 MAG: hypothetical protein A2086_00615 [Spirochaetes bacterium GWD1_27_9]
MEIIEGYHGTDYNNFQNIKNNNFVINYNRDQWLGKGVYFFIKDFNNPISDAENWAIAESWDNDNKIRKYDKYIVIKAEIIKEDENKILDLRNNDGLKIFNYYRGLFINSLKENKLLAKRESENIDEITDAVIFESMKEKLGIDIIINQTYIKFTTERVRNIKSLVPNTVIMSVSNIKIIKKESIIKIGDGFVPKKHSKI